MLLPFACRPSLLRESPWPSTLFGSRKILCKFLSIAKAITPEFTSINDHRVSDTIAVANSHYKIDRWTNVPPNILAATSEQLHLRPNHPLLITRKLIESKFPGYTYHTGLSPAVSVYQNFDSLGFPADHPGRSQTDTYYINSDTVLRTHTSAHQVDIFRQNENRGNLVSADVYRRDAVDRRHYPVFHQMEGARLWDRSQTQHHNVAEAVQADLRTLSRHNMIVEDPNPVVHPERNPLQPQHTLEETQAIAAHLKHSIELVVAEIFSRARAAATNVDADAVATDPLHVRWVEAYFPFTSPSWELEIFWQGDWLEVLGCGVVLQSLLDGANVPNQLGWAFGLGLERIAMLLFDIPDIRLFWSRDDRFLSQFDEKAPIKKFTPFSKHPECYKDVSFWVRDTTNNAGGEGSTKAFHENDLMEIVRNEAGTLVEDVRLTDEFTHPRSRRRSMCYRINYRSHERTLTNEEVNAIHERTVAAMVRELGVEIR